MGTVGISGVGLRGGMKNEKSELTTTVCVVSRWSARWWMDMGWMGWMDGDIYMNRDSSTPRRSAFAFPHQLDRNLLGTGSRGTGAREGGHRGKVGDGLRGRGTCRSGHWTNLSRPSWWRATAIAPEQSRPPFIQCRCKTWSIMSIILVYPLVWISHPGPLHCSPSFQYSQRLRASSCLHT